MKILYSVQGDGKGHAIRSSVTLEWLKNQGHNVLITASNDAYPILHHKFGHVIKIEGARMLYERNSLLVGKTVNEFFKGFPKRMTKNLDIFFTIGNNFKPDIVITDMEPMAYYFAKLFNVPIISIDNNSFIARCKEIPMPKGDRDIFMATRLMFGFWTPLADYYIISTFINSKASQKNVIFVPPILRKQILDCKPGNKGHVLVYQTSDKSKNFLDVLKKFDKKFIVYGLNINKKEKNLIFRKFNEDQFFRDLGDSKAVIANGGYTLMGESIYLHKPFLSVPIKKQVEQIYNAICIEKLGYGLFLKSFSHEGIKRFFDNLEIYEKNLMHYHQDGNKILFKHLEQLLAKYKHKKKISFF